MPDADPAKYLPSAEIRAVLDRVHGQVLRELPSLAEPELDQPVPHPHPFAKTKLAETLHYAHRTRLVHRDIKPGTPTYMSPKQARGEGRRVDGRAV